MFAHFYTNRPPYAIVIDLNTTNGLQTARILSAHQVPVIGVAKDPKHFGCRTHVCEKILFADTSGTELIDLLKHLGPKLPQKAVLIPCSDANVLLVSRHRETLKQWYLINLPPQNAIEILTDKLGFLKYAREKNLPIPETWLIRNSQEAEEVSRKATFPCILKPPMSAERAWQKHSIAKAFKIENPEGLLAVYNKVGHLVDVLILQQWISGPETNHYTCNCYYDRHSKPIITFVSRKIRQWPPQTGEGCLSVACLNETVKQETLRLFDDFQYRGFGYIEMKQDDRSGKYLIIEPNIGRPTGRSAIAEAGGVDYIYTMYCESVGWELPGNRIQTSVPVLWMYIRRDLQASLLQFKDGSLTLRAWLSSLWGKKWFPLFNWNDPEPFFADLLFTMKTLFSKSERKRREFRVSKLKDETESH